MRLTKLALLAATSVFLTGTLFAQDFSSWGEDTIFGGDDFSSFDSSSDSFGNDDFGSFGNDDFGSFCGDDFGSFGGGASEESPITFSGKFSLDTRMYFAKDDSKNFVNNYTDKSTTMARLYSHDSKGDKVYFTDSLLKAFPKAKLGVAYSGSMADASLTVNLTKDTLTDYKEDIVDELILRGYFLDSHLTLEAGKMKIVWGKGDKLHVLDNFNADDYTDFIVPDYIDRRLSTPMLRAVYAFDGDAPFTIEGVFTPFLPKDRFAKEGVWVPGSFANLSTNVKSVVSGWASAGGTAGMLKASQFKEDDMYPDTNNLKYAQAGLHLSGTAGTLDWGVMYYFGRYKQPSADLSEMIKGIMTAKMLAASGNLAGAAAAQAGIKVPELDYDRKHTVGAEFATIVGRFNLRGELAYNITNDTKGDNRWVHNNSLQWLFGFDLDVPINNMNINVQETGTYILNSDLIDKNKDGLKEYDVDYDPKDRYTNDKLVVNISDSWMHDRLKPEITFMWGIERGDLVVQPKVTYSPTPNLSLYANVLAMFCRDKYSEFYYWKNNNFLNLGVSFEF